VKEVLMEGAYVEMDTYDSPRALGTRKQVTTSGLMSNALQQARQSLLPRDRISNPVVVKIDALLFAFGDSALENSWDQTQQKRLQSLGWVFSLCILMSTIAMLLMATTNIAAVLHYESNAVLLYTFLCPFFVFCCVARVVSRSPTQHWIWKWICTTLLVYFSTARYVRTYRFFRQSEHLENQFLKSEQIDETWCYLIAVIIWAPTLPVAWVFILLSINIVAVVAIFAEFDVKEIPSTTMMLLLIFSVTALIFAYQTERLMRLFHAQAKELEQSHGKRMRLGSSGPGSSVSYLRNLLRPNRHDGV
jgi:hypothetical protein